MSVRRSVPCVRRRASPVHGRRRRELAAVARAGRAGDLERDSSCRPNGSRTRTSLWKVPMAPRPFVADRLGRSHVRDRRHRRRGRCPGRKAVEHTMEGKPWVHPDSVAADRKHTLQGAGARREDGQDRLGADRLRRAGLRRAPPRAAASPARRRPPTGRWCSPTSAPKVSTRTTSTASWRGRRSSSFRRSAWAPARRRSCIRTW